MASIAPYWQSPLAALYLGDAAMVLQQLPAESVDLCVTSPPFWGLRDYKVEGQIGLEPTPELWLEHILAVFREVRRVLRPWGTCWIEIGDSYSQTRWSNAQGTGAWASKRIEEANPVIERVTGLPAGNLVGIPFRLALALQADGWWLRSVIIWDKPAPMPESIKGWRFERHRVIISEYERLRSLQSGGGGHLSNRAGSLQGLSTSPHKGTEGTIPPDPAVQGGNPGIYPERSGKDKESGRQSEVSANNQIQGNRTAAGRDTRNAGEAASLLGLSQGAGEQYQISTDGEGQGDSQGNFDSISGSEGEGGGQSVGGRMDGDSEATQASMLLLREEGADDDGSCNPAIKGREAFAGECGSSLPELQQRQAGQALASRLVDCPGCPKCASNEGLVLRKGSWRPTEAHSYILMLAKSASYFCNGEAVREDNTLGTIERFLVGAPRRRLDKRQDSPYSWQQDDEITSLIGRNLRSVWRIGPEPSSLPHFATFPTALPEKCILAGTSEWGNCPRCRMPWAPVVDTKPSTMNVRVRDASKGRLDTKWGGLYEATPEEVAAYGPEDEGTSIIIAWRPTCACGIPERVTPVVLDPFVGTGTTCVAAQELGRKSLGIDLNTKYLDMAAKRLEGVSLPLAAQKDKEAPCQSMPGL